MQLLRSLEGHRDLRHRELQAILLRAQPSLLSKCVGTIVIPTLEFSTATSSSSSSHPPSVTYLCALTQLAYLCSHTDIDPTLKTILRASAMNTVSIRADDHSRAAANNMGAGVDVMNMGDSQDEAVNSHASALHQAIHTLVQVTPPLSRTLSLAPPSSCTLLSCTLSLVPSSLALSLSRTPLSRTLLSHPPLLHPSSLAPPLSYHDICTPLTNQFLPLPPSVTLFYPRPPSFPLFHSLSPSSTLSHPRSPLYRI